MGMSMHVIGYMPADEKWKKMKTVWDACKAARVEPPEEVDEFFEGEDPGDAPGKEVDLEYSGAAKEWKDDMREGFEVDVTQLPEGVRFIRFYCAF